MNLADATVTLRRALDQRDGPAAEQAMVAVLRALQRGERADEALCTELGDCERRANEFFFELARALHGNAVSNRAARAYEDAEATR
jgi:hypothetical protein